MNKIKLLVGLSVFATSAFAPSLVSAQAQGLISSTTGVDACSRTYKTTAARPVARAREFSVFETRFVAAGKRCPSGFRKIATFVTPEAVTNITQNFLTQNPNILSGPVGPQGIQGVKGDAGAVGVQGSVGLRGAVGAAGPQGIQGVKGDAGAVGVQGSIGLRGADGATGPQGPLGLTGSAGANGQSCSVASTASGATITCGSSTSGTSNTTGTSANILNGVPDVSLFNITREQMSVVSRIGFPINRSFPLATGSYAVTAYLRFAGVRAQWVTYNVSINGVVLGPIHHLVDDEFVDASLLSVTIPGLIASSGTLDVVMTSSSGGGWLVDGRITTVRVGP